MNSKLKTELGEEFHLSRYSKNSGEVFNDPSGELMQRTANSESWASQKL